MSGLDVAQLLAISRRARGDRLGPVLTWAPRDPPPSSMPGDKPMTPRRFRRYQPPACLYWFPRQRLRPIARVIGIEMRLLA